MEAELEFLRDQVQLNSSFGQHQHGHQARAPSPLVEVEAPSPWLSDRSLMAPLVTEYDQHIAEMTERLRSYKEQMTELKLKLERVVKENERLHAELRESVEKQLLGLPVASDLGNGGAEQDLIVKNLQEQIQLSEQERVKAVELWQTADQELDRLLHIHQRNVSDMRVQDAQQKQLKDQLLQFQQHVHKLQASNQKLESTNQQLLKTLTEQSTEMEELHTQLRLSKVELRTATAKVEEMTKLLQNLQEQLQRREEDLSEAQERETTADRRLLLLQETLSHLETRLQAASHEAEAVHREQTVWEKKLGELQARCASLEEEKYEALAKVRESIQLAEEAALQKEQALIREKQRMEELEKTRETFKLFVQEAAVRTRNEVKNERKQCNIQIHRMAEELSVLQLESAEKQSLIDRLLREKKAVEEELEKIQREGRAEPELKRIDVLHQRCLDSERARDDLSLTLQTTQSKLKKMEMDHTEELSRCQEELRRLQSSLGSARSDCVTVSEERLKLQQENLQLRREMEELRKSTTLLQRKARQEVSQMEHECSLKERGLEARLQESSHSSSAELTRLLTAQQKSAQRWKDEAKSLVQTFEGKITELKTELSRQKKRSRELEVQLESDNHTISEYERQLAEFQQKTNHLQRRLTQAEQRASAAAQQLCTLTAQRRKTVKVDMDPF